MLASDLPTWFVRAFAFAFGAVWGSFANVVIYRWPRELSIVRPGSHCMACDKPVRAIDNVPIFAWLWLRGRCRDCGARFSIRYPVVELIFAVISMAIAERVFHPIVGGAALEAHLALAVYGVRFAVTFALLTASFIDLDEMIVPWWVKYFALVALVGALVLPTVPPGVSLIGAITGAAVGYFGLRITVIDGYKLLTGRRGMGVGDAEILLVVGALLGVSGVLFALGAGAVQGVVAAGVAWIARRRIGPAHADDVDEIDDDENDGLDEDENADENESAAPSEAGASPAGASGAEAPSKARRAPKLKMPFVPFLALAALEYLLGADALVDAYLRWIVGE